MNIKTLLGYTVVAALAWLTVVIWFPQPPIIKQADVQASLPERLDIDGVKTERWRVYTRRMVWDKAVEAFQKQLQEKQIDAVVLNRKESVMLHVFDDPRRFLSHTEAEAALQEWRGMDTIDILRQSDGTYMLSLGRFYLDAYAQQHEENLRKIGKPFVYHKQAKIIPTFRFVFPALTEQEAETLWKNIQDMGAVDPVMMSESEFNATFVGNMQ